MQKKELLPWVVVLVLMWFALSWYWYVCSIKGFCSVEQWAYKKTNDSVMVPVEEREETEVYSTNQSIETTTTQETVEEVVIECSSHIRSYVRYGYNNSAADVRRIEQFLNDYEGASLNVDGIFSRADETAVKDFQLKYREQVMDPWGMKTPSGYVFRTTRDHMNALYCAYQYAEQN